MIARTPYDALPPALLEELSGAGLDPKAIHDAVAAAVAEDLPGDDVTSAATIPAADSTVSPSRKSVDPVPTGSKQPVQRGASGLACHSHPMSP